MVEEHCICIAVFEGIGYQKIPESPMMLLLLKSVSHIKLVTITCILLIFAFLLLYDLARLL